MRGYIIYYFMHSDAGLEEESSKQLTNTRLFKTVHHYHSKNKLGVKISKEHPNTRGTKLTSKNQLPKIQNHHPSNRKRYRV